MNDEPSTERDEVTITAQNVAVDMGYYWREMESCPVGSKVQLLTAGGLPQYGRWDGKNPFYVGWAPLPKRRPTPDRGAA